MLNIFIKLYLFRKLIPVSVDHDPDISAALCLIKHLFMTTLSSSYHRSKKLYAAFFRELHYLIHHLVNAYFADLPSADRTVGNSYSGKKKAQIIIDLRYGTHRGSGITVGGFLVYRNSRRKALNAFHIRLFHLPQELPGIGGQGLHISPLSLRIDGIKGKGRLSRA